MTNECVSYITKVVELNIGAFFHKYSHIFKSADRERWTYIHTEACSYAIALAGLKEALKIINGKTFDKNKKLAEEVLTEINSQLDSIQTKLPIRIELKEEQDENILKRFNLLDSKNFKNIPKYMPKPLKNEIKTAASLQKYLKGGHYLEINQKDFNINTWKDFDAVKIK
jgi:anaerobic ribonucleoside-triphosphate reductase